LETIHILFIWKWKQIGRDLAETYPQITGIGVHSLSGKTLIRLQECLRVLSKSKAQNNGGRCAVFEELPFLEYAAFSKMSI
jgi:hypothetical protein